MIASNTICQRAEIALSSEEDGKVAIMDIEHGTYFDLEEPGTTIRALIEQPMAFGEICRLLGERFSAPKAEIATDTSDFLTDLKAQSLVLFSE